MKTGLLALAALSSLHLGASQPHGYHHHHPARAVTVTDIAYVTEVVYQTVYADQQPTPAPAPAPAASSPADQAPPAPPAPPAPSNEVPPYVQPPSSSPPEAPATGSSGSSGMGITYAPYKNDGNCKTQDQVNSDFDRMKGYGLVRIYETSCNQVATAISAAKSHGMKLFLGIQEIGNVAGDIQKIIDTVNGDWSVIDTVAVGNELVHRGTSADAVVGALKVAKAMLQGAGFGGAVVTVDTAGQHLTFPQLCAASTYCAVNCHAFFDPNVVASKAGEFVLGQAQMISGAHGGKRVVITESGWPWQGGSNDKAVPSPDNQQAAISSLKSVFSGDMYLFSAFNEAWKQDTARTMGVEKFWGILGDSI